MTPTPLKLCPFCGKPPKLQHWTMEKFGWTVRCSCEIKPETCVYADQEKAIAHWNTRAQDATTAALVKALEDATASLHRLQAHYGPNGAPGWNGMLDEARAVGEAASVALELAKEA
ncbi:MAG: hypothetical protein M0000_06360 [Actinomycetota bacterium]|nr:hypothetical protein [Actinomycetota bacterium]